MLSAARLQNEIDVDLFAGGGGTSTGITQARGRAPAVAINHDPDAIACHTVNHPEAQHYIADVFAVDPVEACAGRPVGLLWLSPDCKHFSKAKGGKPRDKNIRDLAWIAIRWLEALPEWQRPRVIGLENVEEFQSWGPLEHDGNPDPARKGETFAAFVAALQGYGFAVEWRELRACDFGAPTVRKRLYLIARRDGQPIAWPEPTHAKKGARGLRPWRSAAEVIDWSIPCPSIFLTPDQARTLGVRRPLAPATMARIAKGVMRYVIEAAEPFVVSITHQSGDRVRSTADPFNTITTAPRGEFALISPVLIAPHLMTNRNAQKPHNGADEPTHTITAGGAHLNIVAAFLAQHSAGSHPGRPAREASEPVSTVTATGSQQGIVAAHLLNMKGSSRRANAANEPAPAICAQGGHVAEVRAFLMKYYGTAERPGDPELPLDTVTAKARFALVTIAGEQYEIVDIGLRMLTPRELFAAQGFPDDYVIDRRPDGSRLTKSTQIRLVGNSVSPPVACALIAANMDPIPSALSAAA